MKKNNQNAIVLGYIAVHQMFQLALSAYEIGELEAHYCSLVNLPGKVGSRVSRFISATMLNPLGARELPSDRIHELPRPIIFRYLQQKMGYPIQDTYLSSNKLFSIAVASKLQRHQARIFVGAETCALEAFRKAKTLGMQCVLDCPSIPAEVLDINCRIASEELGIPLRARHFHPEMQNRKKEEIELADVILVCSDLARDLTYSDNSQKSKIQVHSLWADDCFFQSSTTRTKERKTALRVLYAGRSSLAKGVPYLMNAVDKMGQSCHLTLCGVIDDEIRTWAGSRLENYTLTPWVPRQKLTELFSRNDLLVLPSLGDSFGFIAIEAMAYGLPVIVSTMTGVPVPEKEWRIPWNCTNSLITQLTRYVSDRQLLDHHSQVAMQWAGKFTAANYRSSISTSLRALLACS
jgi:glycosyltransferase involved in cell wall biosynthesis